MRNSRQVGPVAEQPVVMTAVSASRPARNQACSRVSRTPSRKSVVERVLAEGPAGVLPGADDHGGGRHQHE
ncbi:hypothetical protein ACFV4N_26045 [Actinosynnema sp. NPDC059797]